VCNGVNLCERTFELCTGTKSAIHGCLLVTIIIIIIIISINHKSLASVMSI